METLYKVHIPTQCIFVVRDGEWKYLGKKPNILPAGTTHPQNWYTPVKRVGNFEYILSDEPAN